MSSNSGKLIQHWWSQTHPDYDLQEWVEASYLDPVPFWNDLFTLKQSDFSSDSSTVLFEKYDFYSDCIKRHCNKDLAALRTIDASGQARSWSYDQIDRFVNIQVSLWVADHEIVPGKRIAIVAAYGIEYIVALMAALKLGAAISVIPVSDLFCGEDLQERFLVAIQPDLVVSSPSFKIPSPWKSAMIDLSLEKTFGAATQSHTYAGDEKVQIVFNPFENQIATIEATRSYLIPLRDGALVYNLSRKRTWARPFLSLYLEEPFSTLTALMHGATLIYTQETDLQSHPQLLKGESVDLLTVTNRLQKLWLQFPDSAPSKLSNWYRSPMIGTDQGWQTFSKLNHIGKASTFKVVVDRENSGVTLFSKPQPVEIPSFLYPSLGTPWQLTKIGSKNEPSVEGIGLFHIDATASTKPYIVLSQIDRLWHLTTTLLPVKEGYPYPIDFVEKTLQSLDFVAACMVIPERDPHHFVSQQFVLLVFLSPKERPNLEQQEETKTAMIHHLVRTQVGEAFRFSHIFFYTLYPKLKNRQIDRHWVEDQHRRGILFQKQKRSLYHTLNCLRHAIYEKGRTL